MKYALVNKKIAYLKTEPAFQSELADEAIYGMKLELLSEPKDNWVEVKTPYFYSGFAHTDELLFNERFISIWDNAEKKIVLQNFVDVLSKPKVQGSHIKHLTRGALLAPIDVAGSYTKVMLCDGETGYVHTSYLGDYHTKPSSEDEDTLRQNFVDSAMYYMNTPYRWGGKTNLGIDCSGLCSQAYLMNGVIIHRDANMKPEFCMHEISMDKIGKGDLIFFPGHVAMYIGNNKYIHATAATNSERVVINSLDENDIDFRADLKKMISSIGSIF